MVEQTENKVIKVIKETRKIFNELRNSFSREEILGENFTKKRMFINI